MARQTTTEVARRQSETNGGAETGQKHQVVTCLTFADRCEEAVNYYVAAFKPLFKGTQVTSMQRSQTDGPVPKGKVLGSTFQLGGTPFTAFDGGSYFSFAMGTSIMIHCDSQTEIDELWKKLSKGGEEQPCGWLKDQFGMSWQIIPRHLGKWLTDSRSGHPQKAMEAMLKMKKLDMKRLEDAYRMR